MNERNKQIANLIDLCESMFTCEHGPQKAFFHIPMVGGEPMPATYVIYSVQGANLDDLIEWYIENTLRSLRRKAGEGAFLFWRLSECFRISIHNGEWFLYTRVVVLDKNLNAITVEPGYKIEGGPTPQPLKEPRVIQDYE